jgi:hypothetical protein
MLSISRIFFVFLLSITVLSSSFANQLIRFSAFYNQEYNSIYVTDSLGNRTDYALDDRGQIASITDTCNNTFILNRDIKGEVATVTFPDGEDVDFQNPCLGLLEKLSEINQDCALQKAKQYRAVGVSGSENTMGDMISADPIGLAGGDVNLYRYARSNPLRYTDPLGLESDLDRYGIYSLQTHVLDYMNTTTWTENPANKGGGRFMPSPMAIQKLNDLATTLQTNITVTGAGRSPEANALPEIKGVTNSRHLLKNGATATDVILPGSVSNEAFRAAAKGLGYETIKYYPIGPKTTRERYHLDFESTCGGR